MKKPGYEADIVITFLDANGERNEAGVMTTMCGHRFQDSHRTMIERWADRDTVELGKVDDLLHRYGLMLWELEHYAELMFGRCGFVDPYEEKELVS